MLTSPNSGKKGNEVANRKEKMYLRTFFQRYFFSALKRGYKDFKNIFSKIFFQYFKKREKSFLNTSFQVKLTILLGKKNFI